MVYALAAFGYLTDFLARESMMQIVTGGQVLLLNYAMVQRWRLLNEQLLAAEHDARTHLEFKVHERTAQLRNTMRELEQANRQLADLSLNDALTGLNNRRYLDRVLPELCAETRRTGQPFALILLDADHFKSINDTWGHSFGDTCLQLIARILTRHLKRPRDTAIRFGGEEFAMLLPGTGASGALSVCKAILHDVANTQLSGPDGADVSITLSAGLALLSGDEKPENLFKRADDALYRAKNQGRNQAIVAQDPLQD
jgi:diguanylate cyclase (GGDEF)-like protein